MKQSCSWWVIAMGERIRGQQLHGPPSLSPEWSRHPLPTVWLWVGFRVLRLRVSCLV